LPAASAQPGHRLLPPYATTPERPRIGLALGGGAALGIAHAGVLKWLEEHRVPVDYVAGTSMGGLVGGVYATGMSPEEIETLLLEADWNALFLSDVPYALKTFRRKQDRRNFPSWLELGLRGGVGLPSGLNSGHQVGLLLSRIALPYSEVSGFDELPIPFRCVAVDLDAGKQIVLADGSLAQALRATMAIPGAFAPVRSEGRLLVDGGVLNNVPADVARDMGADVVIAIAVGENLERAFGRSLLELATRALAVMMEDSSQRNLVTADVVLRPDLEDFDVLDFRETAALVKRGYQAAEAHAEQLQAFSLDEAAWEDHLASRSSRERAPLAKPQFVSVEGAPDATAAVLSSVLSESAAGDLDLDRFEADLTRVVGSGRYESASYEVARDGHSRGLLARFQERPHAPPFVNFALAVRSEPDALVFDVGGRLTVMDVVGVGSEWRVDLTAGSAEAAGTELYRPLGASLFAAPRAFYRKATSNVFVEDTLVGSYRTSRTGVGLDIGTAPSSDLELRLGVGISHLDAAVRVGSPDLPELSGREEVLEARLVYDGMHTPIIPEAGLRLEPSLRYYHRAPGTEEPFALLDGALVAAWPTWGQDHGFVELRGGTAFSDTPPLPYRFALCGPFRLGAFTPDEFRGDHFAYARVGYLKSLGRLPDFVGGPIYLDASVELGSAFDRLPDARLKMSLTAGLVLDTVLGPIYAGASVGNGGAFRVYLSIGNVYGAGRASRSGRLVP